MRILPLTLCFALLAGCGDDGVETHVAANVRIDRLLADDVSSLSIFVLGPRQSDGVFLSCEVLMNRVVRPTESKVDILGRADVALTSSATPEATVADVEAGSNRFVYVEAKDAADAVIGNGCTDPVTVKSGEQTSVDVDVFSI